MKLNILYLILLNIYVHIICRSKLNIKLLFIYLMILEYMLNICFPFSLYGNVINCSTLENPRATYQEADAYRVTNAKSPRRSYKRARSHWWQIRGVNYRGGRRNRYRDNQSVAAHLAIHRKSHPPLINLLDQRGRKTRFHNGIIRARRVNVED